MDTGAGLPIGAEVQVTDTGQLQLVDDDGKVQYLETFASFIFKKGTFNPVI